MYYLLLTLWLSQPEIVKEKEVEERSSVLQDNMKLSGITVSEKTESSAEKEDSKCR